MGSLLMNLLNLAPAPNPQPMADVALPQGKAFHEFPCQFGDLSAIVHVGRSQAAVTSDKGLAQSTARQENRSRGCRARSSLFSHCVWLPLWQLVQRKPKKLSMSMNQPSRQSQPIPANTSKPLGRVFWVAEARPALFHILRRATPKRVSAQDHPCCKSGFAVGVMQAYSGRLVTATHRSQPCDQPRFLRLSYLDLLPLAPNLFHRQNLKWFPLRWSQPIPVFINNLVGRAATGPSAFPFNPKGMNLC